MASGSARVSDLATWFREARSRHDACVREVTAGTAPKALLDAVGVAERALDDKVSDEERLYIVSSVADAAKSGQNPEIDPMSIGAKIANDVERVREFRRSGGAIGVLGQRSARPALGMVRANVAALRPPPELVASPFAEWRRASDARGERQTAALEGLLALAERQTRREPITLLAAVASVVAAVVSVIDLVIR